MLTETMRDLQMSVAEYYADSAGAGDLGRRIRGFLTATQTLNDLLANQVAQAPAYTSLFTNDRHPAAGLIEAVKFARNIQQHVLHIVRPSDNMTLIGGTLGFRFYAVWDEVPADVVARLRRGTQALEPQYQAELKGREVTGTMIAVLRFFAEVVPQIIHETSAASGRDFFFSASRASIPPSTPKSPKTRPAHGRGWMVAARAETAGLFVGRSPSTTCRTCTVTRSSGDFPSHRSSRLSSRRTSTSVSATHISKVTSPRTSTT